jgi:hypothetical protein
VLVSALLFGAMHANLLQFQLGLFTGIVFGWWYVRTGSIGPGLVGHAVFNAVAWCSAVFPLHLAPLGPSSGPHIVHQPVWLTLTAVAFVAVGVWWFKGQADSLEALGVAGSWEASIPEEPAPGEPPVSALPPPLDEPPLLEPRAQEQPAQMELEFASIAQPPLLAADPPILEPPLLEPPFQEPPVLRSDATVV